MELFQVLRERHQGLWERAVTHPFVRELGAGTLPMERFQAYLLQDYLFLKDLARLVALAIAGAPDMDSARRLSAFLHSVLEGEESLFRQTFRSWGMGPEAYLHTRPLPVTRAFGDLMARAGHEGFAPAMTVLAVTEGTYLEWATRLAGQGLAPQIPPPYLAWVEVHSTPGFRDFVGWLHATLDGLAVAPDQEEALEDTFLAALRYEAAFWDSAYHPEPGARAPWDAQAH